MNTSIASSGSTPEESPVTVVTRMMALPSMPMLTVVSSLSRTSPLSGTGTVTPPSSSTSPAADRTAPAADSPLPVTPPGMTSPSRNERSGVGTADSAPPLGSWKLPAGGSSAAFTAANSPATRTRMATAATTSTTVLPRAALAGVAPSWSSAALACRAIFEAARMEVPQATQNAASGSSGSSHSGQVPAPRANSSRAAASRLPSTSASCSTTRSRTSRAPATKAAHTAPAARPSVPPMRPVR